MAGGEGWRRIKGGVGMVAVLEVSIFQRGASAFRAARCKTNEVFMKCMCAQISYAPSRAEENNKGTTTLL